MTSARRRTTIAVVVAALVGGGTGIVLGLTEDDEDPPATTSPSEASGAISPDTGAEGEEGPGATAPDGQDAGEALPPPEDDPEGLEPGPSGPAPESADERAAASAARSYIASIDSRDAPGVCGAFASGALDGFDFPAGGGGCGSQVRASLGFEPRGGQPVWESSETTKAISAQIDGDSARVVATIFTTYDEVREPTIEDDIMYFERSGSSWKLAKPSLTLYRAVGDADPPPSVLAPPSG